MLFFFQNVLQCCCILGRHNSTTPIRLRNWTACAHPGEELATGPSPACRTEIDVFRIEIDVFPLEIDVAYSRHPWAVRRRRCWRHSNSCRACRIGTQLSCRRCCQLSAVLQRPSFEATLVSAATALNVDVMVQYRRHSPDGVCVITHERCYRRLTICIKK